MSGGEEMPQAQDLKTMLEQLDVPAFLVRDGVITERNFAAEQHLAEIGAKIPDILITGQEEYADFQRGNLYLTVQLAGTVYPCTVTQLLEDQLFQLEEPAANSELQALALAASQLSFPLSELSVLLSRLAAIPEDDRSKISQSIHKLQRILGNMSDAGQYAHNTPGMMTYELCAILEEVLEKSKCLLAQSSVSLQYSVPSQPIYSLAAPEILKRALYNLLSNAVKFSSPDAAIECAVKQVGNKVYVTVSNLPNSTPVAGGNIFRRYLRSPGLENPKCGIGLGMQMIHGAAAAHGGTVLVEQLRDKGTRITMTIAIQKAKDNPVRSPVIIPDIYGGQDQALVELSDVLPYSLY